MTDTVRIYGTLNDMPLALVRERARGVPGAPGTHLGLYLTQGADQRFVADFPDNPSGIATASVVATAILNASAVAGMTIRLG